MSKQKTHYIHDRWEFDSFADFIETVREPLTDEQRNAWFPPSSEKICEGSNPWSGTETIEEAYQLLEDGWPQGLAELEQCAEQLSPYVVAAQRQLSEDLAPAGYRPDVPAFCTGVPASMYAPGETMASQAPVLRLLVSLNGLSNVHAESFTMRGAALCALVDYFENAGTRVEIEGCFGAQWRGNNREKILIEATIPIKAADEHIEPDRLAFMLCNAAVFRRFCFRLMEKNAEAGAAGMRGSYGRTAELEPDADQVLLPSVQNYRDAEEALRTVLRHVNEYLDPAMRDRVSEDWVDVLGTTSRAVY